mgnify:CR=1 FL=1
MTSSFRSRLASLAARFARCPTHLVNRTRILQSRATRLAHHCLYAIAVATVEVVVSRRVAARRQVEVVAVFVCVGRSPRVWRRVCDVVVAAIVAIVISAIAAAIIAIAVRRLVNCLKALQQTNARDTVAPVHNFVQTKPNLVPLPHKTPLVGVVNIKIARCCNLPRAHVGVHVDVDIAPAQAVVVATAVIVATVADDGGESISSATGFWSLASSP